MERQRETTSPGEIDTAEKLLIVISDRALTTRGARAGERRVMCWQDGDAGARSGGEGVFSGDPTRAESFAWTAGARSVSAVIDLADDRRAAAVLDAVRAVRSDAAMLVLSDGIRHPRGDGTLARSGDLRDVVRLDLDDELQRLEGERRVHCLRQFVSRESIVPIVVHPDPDPDAISSALALRTILQRKADTLPIVTTRMPSRPENRRMLDLLRVRMTESSPADLRRFSRLITVDSQPTVLGDFSEGPAPRLATIDHHPAESGYDAEFLDIRPSYGATATIMTEYLRTDARLRIGAPLATALLHGIRTDTDGLGRGVTAQDVEAYAFLQEHADPVLLRRLERPAYPVEAARAYGAALAAMERDNDTVVAYAGTLDSDRQHVLADLADFCLGIQGITWAIAAARINEELVLGLRHHGPGPGAGDLARKIAGEGGRGGGHATMGRVSVSESLAAEWVGSRDDPARALLEQVRRRIESLEG